MYRLSALLLLPLAVARPLKAEERYETWLAEFGGKHKGTAQAFYENVAKIKAHNADPSQTWKMGVNQFTALSSAEFKEFSRGYVKPSAAMRAARPMADISNHVSVAELPPAVDWRNKSVVTPVKNQGGCGGCWAFASTETIESAVAINTGKLMVLSQQQIIDCTPNPNDCGGTGGCNGATQELAFNYVSSSPGLSLNISYPWTGGTTYPQCQTQQIHPVARIDGYVALPYNNYSALMNAVATIGPIAISAAAEPWQHYQSGVFTGPSSTDVDHIIQLVGYGHDNTVGLDYYLVRNSWTAQWGEDGYIRVARYGSTPAGEPCGIDNTPGDGDGCNGGPSEITVCGVCGILADSAFPTGATLA